MDQQLPPGTAAATAFLKLWLESFNKLGQAAFAFSPEALPPEMMRQVRTGIFQALSQSWDEFLRSPHFMEGIKQTLDNAMAFRKLSTDLLTRTQHNLSGVAQSDIEATMQVVQRLERRVLDRLDALSLQVTNLASRLQEFEARDHDNGSTATPKPVHRYRSRRAPARTRSKRSVSRT